MPLTSKICSNLDSDIDLSSSTKYMMSDKTDVDDPIQVCFNNQPHNYFNHENGTAARPPY